MISLSSAIEALRTELATATAKAATEPTDGVLLSVADIEVELQVAITEEAKAGAEVNIWVVKLGGEGGGSTASTHTVRLKLDARAADGQPLAVGSRRGPLPVPGATKQE